MRGGNKGEMEASMGGKGIKRVDRLTEDRGGDKGKGKERRGERKWVGINVSRRNPIKAFSDRDMGWILNLVTSCTD